MGMNTDVCSIASYKELMKTGNLGRLQAMFLDIFIRSYPEPLTAWQATRRVEDLYGTGFSINGIGSRLSELGKMGFLDKHDRARCTHTQKIVNRWIYTGRKSPKEKIIRKCCCDKCEGRGFVMEEVYIDTDMNEKRLF